MSDIIVPLRSRRQQRAVLAQKLQHAIPGVVLLTAGLQTLSEHPHGTELGVAIVEIAASVLLLGSMARTLHAKRHLFRSSSPSSSAAASEHAPHAHAAHAGIEWMDLFASAVLVGEGLERKMHGQHFPRPTMLAAATLAVLGLLHGRMQHFAEARRSIRVTADALFVPGRPFKVRRLHAKWEDLQSIDVGERWAVITTRTGRVRKIDLQDLEGAHHVRAALLEGRQLLTDHRSG